MGNAIDRSKFKNLGTNVADMYAADKELNKQMGKKDGSSRPGYLNIDKDGSINLFRIYPPHPEEDGGGITFSEPKVVVFLPVELPKKDDQGNVIEDKKGNIETEIKRKAIFNAVIHGTANKDLVDEFINIARRRADEWWPNKNDEDDKASRAKFLGFIYGAYNKKDPKKSIQGINYSQSWVVYADKIDVAKGKKEFGRLEMKKSIKDRLNALAALESSGQPLGIDPFTDIDEGRAITIRYNSEAVQPANYYQTEFDSVEEIIEAGGKKFKARRQFPLSDEDLLNWSQQDPLAKMFKNVFKKSDFAHQLEGLERHDKEHNLGIFDDPEFQEIAVELSEFYASMSDDEEVEQDSVANKPLVDIDSEEEEEGEEDSYDLMDRNELKKEMKKRKLGVVVKPNMSDDSLRDLLREDDEAAEEESEEDELFPEDDQFADNVEEEEEQPTLRNKVAASQKSNAKKAIEEEYDDLPWDKDGNDKARVSKDAKKKEVSERLQKLKRQIKK